MDLYASLKHLLENAKTHRIDPEKVFNEKKSKLEKKSLKVCVLGEEAGGYLTMALGLFLAQKGEANLVNISLALSCQSLSSLTATALAFSYLSLSSLTQTSLPLSYISLSSLTQMYNVAKQSKLQVNLLLPLAPLLGEIPGPEEEMSDEEKAKVCRKWFHGCLFMLKKMKQFSFCLTKEV